METSLVFWVVMLIWLLFGIWNNWPAGNTKPWGLGGHIVLWLLLLLLGWRTFGPIVHS